MRRARELSGSHPDGFRIQGVRLEAVALIQKAIQLGAGTERENDLIHTVGVFDADVDTLNQRTRAQSYAKAMEAVARRRTRGSAALSIACVQYNRTGRGVSAYASSGCMKYNS